MLLLSGGFDSPVAGYLMRERGLSLRAIHFSLEPVTDDAAERKATRIAEVLGIPTLYVARVGDAFKEVVKECRHRLYFVLTKRLMVRIASEVARRQGCDYLVTGENLGQVSSQTLPNLLAIDEAATVPVLRPLIGFDKQEIIDRAKSIGTYEISEGPEICDSLGPKHPATNAKIHDVAAEEAKFDVAGSVARTVTGIRSLEFPGTPIPEAGV